MSFYFCNCPSLCLPPFLSPALEKWPSSVSPLSGGLGVARATPEDGQRGVKEKPLILTFRQPIEDHVNQDVGSAPAGPVAAETRRRLRRRHRGAVSSPNRTTSKIICSSLAHGDRLKPPHQCMCGLETCSAVGGRGALSEARRGQRLPNECTSGAEERFRGQGRSENGFWRASLFHSSRDSPVKKPPRAPPPLCPPAIQPLRMLIANKACTSL